MALADPTVFGYEPGNGPLRAGGVTLSGLPSDERDLPSTVSPVVRKMRPDVELVRDLWLGTRQVRSRGTAYLPKGAGERADDYGARLQRSVFFEAFRKTIEGLSGLVFRTDPVLSEDVPDVIVDQWENIDNAGTHGDVFLRDRLQDALIAGHTLILVEYPRTDGTATRADEAPLGPIRPYWVPIAKDNILSWRSTVENGQLVLTQLVVRECQWVADGAFGQKEQTRFRVFYRNEQGVVGFQLLEVDDKRVVHEIESGTYPTQVEIPVAEVVSSGRRGMFESDPPLLGLAWLNISHYQQASDADWARYKTNVPILFGAGIQPAIDENGQEIEINVGPNCAVWTSDPSAKLEYVAHDGASLDSCAAALETLKSDMGTLGIAMLAPQKRSAETAEAKRLDKATQDSALSVTARGLQDATERALGFHARYLGLPSGGSVEINRDFEGLAMDPAVMTALVAAVAAGLPWEPVINELIKGGRLPEDTDAVALVAEIAINEAAKQEFEREQMENKANQFPPEKAA